VAKAHGLDPLLPSTWYTFPKTKLRAEKVPFRYKKMKVLFNFFFFFSLQKYHSAIVYYPKCNHKLALMDVFPEIGLKEELFDNSVINFNRRWYRSPAV